MGGPNGRWRGIYCWRVVAPRGKGPQRSLLALAILLAALLVLLAPFGGWM